MSKAKNLNNLDKPCSGMGKYFKKIEKPCFGNKTQYREKQKKIILKISKIWQKVKII